jgi:hypothetical protein
VATFLHDTSYRPGGKTPRYVWAGCYFGFFVYDLHRKQWIEKGKGKMAVTQFLDSGEKETLLCSLGMTDNKK